MVRFLRLLSGFRYPIKALFALLARNLFHYMAEWSESPFACQESNQGLRAECGFERAFIFIFSLYFALLNILLLAKDIALYCSNAFKGKRSQHNNFLVTENY